MNNLTQALKHWRRFFCALGLVLALVSLNGCGDNKTGADLAKAGIATGNTLANYYDALVQDTVDIWEMETFSASIRGVPFAENQQKPLQEQIEALQHRARLARRLVSTYSALKELSSYDASAEVKGAAEKLAQEVQGIPAMPKSNIEPSGIIGSLAADISAWQQSKEIKKGAKIILKTLLQVKELFDRETRVYKSIAGERGNKISSVVEYLLRKKLVIGLPLLQKASESLGMPWAAEKKPLEDEQTIEAVIAMARVRTQRMAFLSADAAADVANAISLLIDNHRKFQNKKALALGETLATMQKAQSYLDEIAKLRQESNNK